MKRFLKPRELESNPHLTHDDDSIRSDTLCGSEESEDDKTKPTTDPSAHPLKTVAFDLPSDELTRNNTPCHADEPENDDDNDDNCNAPTGVKGQTLAKGVRLLGKLTGSYGKPEITRVH